MLPQPKLKTILTLFPPVAKLPHERKDLLNRWMINLRP